MSGSNEGAIKFQCQLVDEDIIKAEDILGMNDFRIILCRLGLIGVASDGVAFGNISIRQGNSSSFVISGTQTGGKAELAPQQYTLVTSYDFEKNTVTCHGSIMASSESLTHAAVYESDLEIGAVVHVHCPLFWKTGFGVFPTTRCDAEYGTPLMAGEIKRLFMESSPYRPEAIVMGGHREGVLFFSENLLDLRLKMERLFLKTLGWQKDVWA